MQSGSFAVEEHGVEWDCLKIQLIMIMQILFSTNILLLIIRNLNYSQGNYPIDLSSQSAQTPIDKRKEIISDIEFYSLNSITQER